MNRKATPGSFGPNRPPPKSPGRPRKLPSFADNFDYKAECGRLLPRGVRSLERILKQNPKTTAEKALHARITEMLADRVYGRPAQALVGANGGPLAVAFAQILGGIDGTKAERFGEKRDPAANEKIGGAK